MCQRVANAEERAGGKKIYPLLTRAADDESRGSPHCTSCPSWGPGHGQCEHRSEDHRGSQAMNPAQECGWNFHREDSPASRRPWRLCKRLFQLFYGPLRLGRNQVKEIHPSWHPAPTVWTCTVHAVSSRWRRRLVLVVRVILLWKGNQENIRRWIIVQQTIVNNVMRDKTTRFISSTFCGRSLEPWSPEAHTFNRKQMLSSHVHHYTMTSFPSLSHTDQDGRFQVCRKFEGLAKPKNLFFLLFGHVGIFRIIQFYTKLPWTS